MLDVSSAPNKKNLLPLAKNALRKLRTVRHPDVLKFIDAVETDTSVSIVTERVQPLGKALSNATQKGARDKEDWIVWGLHRVSVRTVTACLQDSLTMIP
jgi:SCY1-like protein 1